VDILIIAGVRSLRPSGLGRTWRCAMTTTVTSTGMVVADPAFSDPERFALAGFLADEALKRARPLPRRDEFVIVDVPDDEWAAFQEALAET
jgi:hypothetical protein